MKLATKKHGGNKREEETVSLVRVENVWAFLLFHLNGKY
jgi:hypothetical protein